MQNECKVIKILIISQSATIATGTAQCLRLIFESLLNQFPAKYEVFQLGLGHTYSVSTVSWPIYSTRTKKLPDGSTQFDINDLYGEQSFESVYKTLLPDIVFAFNDPQKIDFLCHYKIKFKFKLILYTNFDGFPIPEDWNIFKVADRILTMSKFSKDAFLKTHNAELKSKTSYMHAGIDLSLYHPVSITEKRKLRDILLPHHVNNDSFILGWVGKNQWRKQNWILYLTISILRHGYYLYCKICNKYFVDFKFLKLAYQNLFDVSYAKFLYSKVDCIYCNSKSIERGAKLFNFYLWLHMPRDYNGLGWSVPQLEKMYNVSVTKGLIYTENYSNSTGLLPENIPYLYQVMDVLLYLTGGEGFGMPALEAMACGIPSIYTDYSSHAEIIGNGNSGLPIKGILQPELHSGICRLIGDINDIINTILYLYNNPKVAKSLRSNGIDYSKTFDIKNITLKWDDIFSNT